MSFDARNAPEEYARSVRISPWKVEYEMEDRRADFPIEEFCLSTEHPWRKQFCRSRKWKYASSRTGRAATILGVLVSVPAGCAYAYLAAKSEANFTLEIFLAICSFILMSCSFAAASCAAGRAPANLNVPAAPAHEVGSTSGFLGGMHR